MNRTLRIILWTLLVLFTMLCFVVLLPSLFGLVMMTLLIFAIMDFASRRHLNATRAFNSTLRAVCKHDGAITKVAIAFSKSGPLSGPCYEYARRLMMGQDPIEAAARSHVPLQLSTAVALQTPACDVATIPRLTDSSDPTHIPRPSSDNLSALDRFDRGGTGYESSLASMENGWMPAYGQFLYLVVTSAVSCAVFSFMALFIVPTLEVMSEEFGISLTNRWMMSARPAYWILLLLSFIVMIVVPIMSRGHIFGIGLPTWFPITPRLAQHKSEVLNGLADAIEHGWPMGRALAVGHLISVRRNERRSLQRAMELIEQGRSPADAIHRTGWIDRYEAAWLDGAPAARSAELLRTFASQTIRDAQSNLRWLMTLLFPTIVVLLSAAVLAYAFGFFSGLFNLIYVLAGPSS